MFIELIHSHSMNILDIFYHARHSSHISRSQWMVISPARNSALHVRISPSRPVYCASLLCQFQKPTRITASWQQYEFHHINALCSLCHQNIVLDFSQSVLRTIENGCGSPIGENSVFPRKKNLAWRIFKLFYCSSISGDKRSDDEKKWSSPYSFEK